MAIIQSDFDKIWASQSPLTPYQFTESQYKEGWNFVGETPPSRQMWDFLQKNNDEKMQYLANNYLPLAGGTLTGEVNGITPTAGDDSTKLATTEYVQNELSYKGNILLARTLVNSAVTLNVNCSGYKFVILRLEGNDGNMQDFLIPVGSDFYFAHKIFGTDNGTVSVNTKGHFDTVNGQLVIREVLFIGWAEIYVTVIGAM
jgi:hypothetical protein